MKCSVQVDKMLRSFRFNNINCSINPCVLLTLSVVCFLSLGISQSHAFLFEDGEQSSTSCVQRCDTPLDNNRPCQCNVHCTRFNDCCDDYTSVCVDHTCSTISQIAQQLWDSDTNRLTSSDLTVNYQTHVTDGTTTDNAHQLLFSYVNPSKLSVPTIAAFNALLDNYQPNEAVTEHSTTHEDTEINTFLDAAMTTQVMNTLLHHFQCRGFVTTQSELKALLKRLWFDFFSRSSKNAADSTSGFEHYIGEYKSASIINGFHSWLSFYNKESHGHLNYLGYVSKKTPNLVGAVFSWGSHVKTKGTMFVGVSPEFDLAIYTLCYKTNKNGACSFTMEGQSLTIISYDKNGHIATAYVV